MGAVPVWVWLPGGVEPVQAGRALTALELLERGVPDGVGAIEVCTDIETKLGWQPKALDQLQSLAQELDAAAPASRALRRLDEDLDTSAGDGQRPLIWDWRLTWRGPGFGTQRSWLLATGSRCSEKRRGR
jgi:hypothetical protein